MGNILLHRFATTFQKQPPSMHRPFNKKVPQRQNLQPLPNKNNAQKIISHPKNGRNCTQVTEISMVTEVKPVSNQVIIASILSLINQQHGYDQCWNLFLQIVKNIFKFNLIFPVPLNANGQQLLKNGSFVVCWLRIISRNPFINMPIIHRNVEAQFLPKITHQRQFLQSYLKQHKLNEEKKTPLKNPQYLKRSVLKTSEKKVQFGKDQIIYPVLESYREKNRQKKKSKQEIKREIRQKLGFILDYFQINDILLLEEVQIIGVIKQFENTYAVMLVKQRSNSKQRTCIGIITDKKIETHSLKTIQEVEKNFQNLCYLELDGNDPSSVWINNLPSDMSE